MTTIEALEDRVNALEASILQMQANLTPTTAKADTASSRVPQVDENTVNIADNSDGLFDVASLADENSQAIMELAEIISELEG